MPHFVLSTLESVGDVDKEVKDADGWVVLGGGSEESGREIFYWKSKDGCLSSNKSLLSKLNIDSTDVQKTWAVCSFCLLVKS